MESKLQTSTLITEMTPATSTQSYVEDMSYGCILGALLGDASGTYLEFSQQVINNESVKKSLSLCGGGPHNVAPGQITDDGELTLCLMQGIINGKGVLNLKEIVIMYSKWIQSKPFDIGGTIRNSFFKCDQKNPQPQRVMKAACQKKSATSQSNGSLMRISPLAVWCQNLDEEQLIMAVRSEVSLSHSNKVIQDAAVCYCLAIKFILNQSGTRFQAYEFAKDWARTNSNKEGEVYDWFKIIDRFTNGVVDTDIVTPKKAGGWARHAFILSFNYLKQEDIDYKTAIYNTLMLGGDTDTNACIVGGMIGACVGMSKLPQQELNTMINCNIKLGQKKDRPKFLQTKGSVMELIQKLIAICPSKLDVKM